MARPAKELPVATPLVPALVRYVRSRGGDAVTLARRFGLALDIEARDDATLAPTRVSELLEAAAEVLGEPCLALRLPGELVFRTYAPPELVVHASATVGDALMRIARYAHFAHPQLQCAFAVDAAGAHFRQTVDGPPKRTTRHVHEYGLAHALTHAARAHGAQLTPTRVWFASARVAEVAPLHRFFGTRDLTFGCEDSGFTLPASAAMLPTRAADPRLLSTFEALAEAALLALPQPRQHPYESLVAARIEALLPVDVSVEVVAKALHMSPRTLQRRLDDEGTRFTEVQDGVRERVARRLIGDASITLLEVAYRIGFSDLATFSRAFKRWTGKPPGTFRSA